MIGFFVYKGTYISSPEYECKCIFPILLHSKQILAQTGMLSFGIFNQAGILILPAPQFPLKLFTFSCSSKINLKAFESI